MSIRLREDEQTFIQSLRRLRSTDRALVFAAVTSFQPVTPAVRGIKTRAEIKAGKGFACTAGCSRIDLKTALRASEHVTTNADLQLRGHIAK